MPPCSIESNIVKHIFMCDGIGEHYLDLLHTSQRVEQVIETPKFIHAPVAGYVDLSLTAVTPLDTFTSLGETLLGESS